MSELKWSFEVRSGSLETLPSLVAKLTNEQRSEGADSFFHAEAGILLNEPEECLTVAVPASGKSGIVIARIGQALSWLFGHLETEIDSHYKWNYLKITFVNLNPLEYGNKNTGQMTTNAPPLPLPSDQPSHLMLHQIVTTMRMFFCHMRGSAELSDWELDLYSCDWVSMTFCKA